MRGDGRKRGGIKGIKGSVPFIPDGIDGLVEYHHGGRPSKLSGEQKQAVKVLLQATPGDCGYPDRQWTGKRLALHLDKQFEVTMSARTCQRIIARAEAGQSGAVGQPKARKK